MHEVSDEHSLPFPKLKFSTEIFWYLRAFVHEKPSIPRNFLHWTEWHYSTTAIVLPTCLLYMEFMANRTPLFLLIYWERQRLKQLLNFNNERLLINILWDNIFKSQKMMKKQADKHKTAIDLKLGIGLPSTSTVSLTFY